MVEGRGGWNEVISTACAGAIQSSLDLRLKDEREERKPTLRLSGMGNPCERKLWYDINEPDEGEVLGGSTLLKFLYGDILEELLLSLDEAAGHTVSGCQDTLQVAGIKGHRDAVIDGITVDVKSASPLSFNKFQSGNLRADDPFGYISQLSSYVYAGRDQTEVESHPSLGAFLVIDKVSGEICLDMYDFGPEIDTKEEDFERIKAMVADKDNVPPRAFEAEPDGYWKGSRAKGEFKPNGNLALGLRCGYCSKKQK